MSRQQVEAILGRPTSVKNIMTMQKLFYKGYVSGSFLVGVVTLYDGQMDYIDRPAFP